LQNQAVPGMDETLIYMEYWLVAFLTVRSLSARSTLCINVDSAASLFFETKQRDVQLSNFP